MLRIAVLALASSASAAPVLAQEQCTTFVVVDDESGNPIEHFGVHVYTALSVGGDFDERDEEILETAAVHVGGEYTCDARPGLDRFRLVAPEYVGVEENVPNRGESSNRVTVRLHRGATLKARATLRGAPVSSAKLWLYDESLVRMHEEDSPGEPFDEASYYWWDEGGPNDPYWVTTAISRLNIDSHGFSIGRLDGGDYRFVIETDEGDRAVVDPLPIARGTTVDLGEVALDAACRIEGHVSLPEGARAVEWTVETVFLGHRARQTHPDAFGHFVLDRLPPTEHHIAVRPEDRKRRLGAGRNLRVAPGETGKIEIDLRKQPSCRLSLDLLINDHPAAGVKVELGPLGLRSFACELQPSDERGHIEGESIALGRVWVTLTNPFGLPLSVLRLDDPLREGVSETRQMAIRAADLSIAWQAEERFVSSLAQVWLTGTELERRVSDFRVQVDLQHPSLGAPRIDAGESRCHLGFIAPGKYDLTLKLFSKRGDFAAFAKRVDVPAAGEFTCEFAAADRVQ